jgi:glucose-1-phosphate adenylyltransferase
MPSQNLAQRPDLLQRGCSIPEGLVVGEDAQADAQRFFRTYRGITLVTAAMLSCLNA